MNNENSSEVVLKKGISSMLFNPFEIYSERVLLVVGVLSGLLGVVFSAMFDVRFDGVLDLHLVSGVGISAALLDFLFNMLSVFVIFYPISKLINVKTRAIDVVNFYLIAKVPLLVLPLFNINNIVGDITDKMVENIGVAALEMLSVSDIVIFSLFSILSIVFIVWFISLMYRGFKVATNARGGSGVGYFIFALILAEIISKILLYYFNS